MPKKTTSNSLIPGADTPEGAARLQKELETRSDIDFRAFQMLRRLNDEGLLSANMLYRTFKGAGESDGFAKEMADELAEKIAEILRARILADHNVLAAAAGIPA